MRAGHEQQLQGKKKEEKNRKNLKTSLPKKKKKKKEKQIGIRRKSQMPQIIRLTKIPRDIRTTTKRTTNPVEDICIRTNE